MCMCVHVFVDVHTYVLCMCYCIVIDEGDIRECGRFERVHDVICGAILKEVCRNCLVCIVLLANLSKDEKEVHVRREIVFP